MYKYEIRGSRNVTSCLNVTIRYLHMGMLLVLVKYERRPITISGIIAYITCLRLGGATVSTATTLSSAERTQTTRTNI